MIKNILLLVIVSLIGVSIFVACTKDELSSDKTAPTVKIFHPIPDTVVMTDTNCVFNAQFIDEGGSGLSAYSIKIWNARMAHETDTFTLKSTLEGLGEDKKDSAIFNKAFQGVRISGYSKEPLKDTTIFLFNGYSIDPMNAKKIPTLLGEHWFKVSVIDRAGNIGIDSFKINVDSFKNDVVKYIKPEDR